MLSDWSKRTRWEIWKSYLIDSTSEVQFIFVLNEPFRRPNERPKSVPESVLDFRTLVRSLISFKLSLTQFENFQVHKSTDFRPSLTGFCFNLHLSRHPTCFNWVKFLKILNFQEKYILESSFEFVQVWTASKKGWN